MSEWIICDGCGMKHRPTRDGRCPRCDRPTAANEVFTEDGRVRATALDSALLPAVPIGLLLTAIAGYAFLRLLGGSGAGLDTRVAVLGGLLFVFISWAWALGLAFREGWGWFFFGLFVPFVSVMAMGRWRPFLIQLVGAGLIAFGVLIAPAGVLGPQGLAQALGQACRSQPGANTSNCTCVGQKAAAMMLPEARKAPISLEDPAIRELMHTAESVCQTEALVARCVSSNRGDAVLCTCIMEGAVKAFTAAELETIEATLASGAMPPLKYDELRTDCRARLGR